MCPARLTGCEGRSRGLPVLGSWGLGRGNWAGGQERERAAVGPDSRLPANPQTPWKELTCTHTRVHTYGKSTRGGAAGQGSFERRSPRPPELGPLSPSSVHAHTPSRSAPARPCPPLTGPHPAPPLSCRRTSRRMWIWPVDQVSACQVRATGGPGLGPLACFLFSVCLSTHLSSSCCACHGPALRRGPALPGAPCCVVCVSLSPAHPWKHREREGRAERAGAERGGRTLNPRLAPGFLEAGGDGTQLPDDREPVRGRGSVSRCVRQCQAVSQRWGTSWPCCPASVRYLGSIFCRDSPSWECQLLPGGPGGLPGGGHLWLG